ncbi:PPC domain-containing protein [Neobacillus cucumis]|uniref:PPC domain-containing protein n=1 Tax=Neobacillus cucumis TaxID=1740721 RepID=UPI00285365F2|nr:pre-peptidase C-terminal domain-containing protein [Neobacillus cucumis]MDR4949921.1 pre-peptidase C-terminal domain-containing protein [Neobacillus cucumis]
MHYQGDDDQDSYGFSLTKTQQVKISIPKKSGKSWEVTLYDADGNNIEQFETDASSTVSGNKEQTYTLSAGTYYLVISENYNTTDVPYEFAIWTATPQITANQVTVTNNTGKSDTISVGGLGTGDTIKVYTASKGGTLLATAKAGSTGSVSMSVAQVGQKAGTLYVTVTKSGWTESLRTPVSFTGEQSKPLSASQVKIENNKGKADVLSVSGLGTGDIVNVYNTSGKLIGVSMPVESGQAAIAFVQLGTTAGKVYVTVTRKGMTESTKIAVSYTGEQTTALLASQVAVVNNKGTADTITVSTLHKGDVIRIYDVNGKYLTTVTSSGSQVTASITQLGTSAGYIFVTNTRTGMTTSAKTKVAYKAE